MLTASVGIHAVHLAGLDERGDDSTVLDSGVVAGEESVLSVQGDRADGAFDSVVVDFQRIPPLLFQDWQRVSPLRQAMYPKALSGLKPPH